MEIRRIVFEGGVTLRRTGSVWTHETARTSVVVSDPRSVTAELEVRPVVLGEVIPRVGETTLLLSRTEEWLDLKGQLYQAGEFLDSKSHWDALNLTYVVGAVIYHCKRLAEVYSDLLQLWVRWPRPPGKDPERLTFGNQAEPYFELEALLSAALRAYDYARFLVWRAFGPLAPCPRSFERMLPALRTLPSVPAELLDRLDASWTGHGALLKEYRDCLHHYVPLGRALPYAILTKLPSGVWKSSSPIPDNPGTRSHDAFRYDRRLDALAYGWSVATEVVDLMRFVCEAVARPGARAIVPTHAGDLTSP